VKFPHTLLCACLLPSLMQSVTAQTPADADDYVFDNRMVRGGALSSSLMDRFNRRETVLPGIYGLDVWVNQKFGQRLNVTFKQTHDGSVAPCLTHEQLDRLGIVPPANSAHDDEPADFGEQASAHACLDIATHVPGAIVHARMDVLRLDLQVPQALTRRMVRGYVDPADLDAGVTAGFVNYMGNYYHAWETAGGSHQSGYLSLQSGLNLGLWQLRQQAYVQWRPRAGAQFKSARTFLQRPLRGLDSQLTLGQTYTGGRFFSGLNYLGASLRKDERMLPDSQRGYAPVVRGVASSNARVSIRQGDHEIYQTTVAPGPFEINDLYPNSYSGDLQVEVLEADGRVERYTVPFSAVPESLREGQWNYEAALGRTHGVGKDSAFADFVYQRGVSNAVTLYGGLRLAQGYQAGMAGGVYASRIGALGADATYSRARLPGRPDPVGGWMMRLSYSNTIASTGTNVTLANYRYSTTGYQDLANVLGMRRGGVDAWVSPTHSQRSRFDIRVNQQLGRMGQVFISGALQDYRDGRANDVQYQLGYGTALPYGMSMNVALIRQQTSSADMEGLPQRRRETRVMVSLSIPLGRSAGAPNINTTMTSGSSERTDAQTQMGFSGVLDPERTLTYSLGGSYDRGARQTVWNGNLQKHFSALSVGLGASHSRSTRQLSANVQGALVAHADGLTLGPYVGDTFALVQAQGASGAKVLNSQARVDANGYALVPVLTPYRYNRVVLSPEGMSASTELVESEQISAPYAGAVVKLSFQTRSGRALLIRTVKNDGLPVPFGSEVFSETGVPLGMVGQGGRIYVRAEDDAGKLAVRWGDAPSEQCIVPYRVDARQAPGDDQPLVRLEGVCV